MGFTEKRGSYIHTRSGGSTIVNYEDVSEFGVLVNAFEENLLSQDVLPEKTISLLVESFNNGGEIMLHKCIAIATGFATRFSVQSKLDQRDAILDLIQQFKKVTQKKESYDDQKKTDCQAV